VSKALESSAKSVPLEKSYFKIFLTADYLALF